MTQDTVPGPESVWTSRPSPGSKIVTSRLDQSDFRDLLPPDDVHWIGRRGGVFWDPAGANQFAHSLALAGHAIQEHRRYLDFGCSSGRTVRTFAAAFPDAEWHGCDPTERSIEWARHAMPHIRFHVSPQHPPTEYPAAHFTGVYAISVWSHFSQTAALEWLSEMHRIIEPGGWLLLSTHGAAAFRHFMEQNPANRPRLLERWHKLLTTGFVFVPSQRYAARGLDTSQWGGAFFSADWLANHIAPHWALLAFDPGRYGGHQDIYALQRR